MNKRVSGRQSVLAESSRLNHLIYLFSPKRSSILASVRHAVDVTGPESAASRFLTRSEVSRLLGVSPNTVTRWAREGRLPCQVTLGGHHRFERELVEQLQKSLYRAGSRAVEPGPAVHHRPPDVAECARSGGGSRQVGRWSSFLEVLHEKALERTPGQPSALRLASRGHCAGAGDGKAGGNARERRLQGLPRGEADAVRPDLPRRRGRRLLRVPQGRGGPPQGADGRPGHARAPASPSWQPRR